MTEAHIEQVRIRLRDIQAQMYDPAGVLRASGIPARTLYDLLERLVDAIEVLHYETVRPIAKPKPGGKRD